MRRSLCVAALALASAIPAPATSQEVGFPHRDHEGLFPLCFGCHQVEPSAATGITLPRPRTCVRCHDGQDRERVEWTGPDRTASNLDFSHAEHPGVSEGGGSEGCRSCHHDGESQARMAVTAPDPARCLSCHEHEAPIHLAPEAECLSCHVPLTGAGGLSRERIAQLPRPDSHQDPAFLLSHRTSAEASVASCSVCHARQSCQRCHLNAGALDPIQRLGPDPRVAALVADMSPEYPEPPEHRSMAWTWEHREAAMNAGTASCANCHTRSTCRSCHLEGLDAELGRLPAPPPDDPRRAVETPPSREMHDPGFALAHKIEASAAPGSCDSCHRRSELCVSCHAGSADPGFHPDDFLAQHAAEAYGNQTECASCHSAEVFCQGCHQSLGLASEGRLDAGFHNARPFWILEHGDGARKGLESCTTCHAQNDCAQCHSARGGWRVNPHGPDFDARRLRDEAPLMCLRCHFGDPLGGGR